MCLFYPISGIAKERRPPSAAVPVKGLCTVFAPFLHRFFAVICTVYRRFSRFLYRRFYTV